MSSRSGGGDVDVLLEREREGREKASEGRPEETECAEGVWPSRDMGVREWAWCPSTLIAVCGRLRPLLLSNSYAACVRTSSRGSMWVPGLRV